MKILIVRTFPSVLDPNGYNIQEIGFAKALEKAGVTCDVVLYGGEKHCRTLIDNGSAAVPCEIKTIENSNVKVYMWRGFGILKNGFFPRLRRLADNYDVIQVHEYDQITSWIYYAFYRKHPVVIYHGPYYDDFNKGYNLKCKVFDNTFLRIKSASQTLCFTKSHAAARFLESKGFANTVPIGVGLDTDNFNTGFGQELRDSVEKNSEDYSNGKFEIIYVGKIEPRRNSYLLADIMKKVTEQCDKVHFTVVGDGEKGYVDGWKSMVKALVDDNRLTYIGRMSQPELRDLYRSSDLMVFPSNYEIFGMVLLEAMYFDVPVISSDNGGSDTLINNGFDGIIVDGFDADKWADEIVRIVEDRERFEVIRDNLKNKDHSVYTWNGIAVNYLESLRRLKGLE